MGGGGWRGGRYNWNTSADSRLMIWRSMVQAWSLPSCNVSLDKKLYSTLTLFTQKYKWVPAITMLGGNLAMD